MMEKEIIEFIKEHNVATVACCDENLPYCYSCYYSFIEEAGILVYKSSGGTKHEKILEKNNNVAGTILPQKVDIAHLKGIQFEGKLSVENFQTTMKLSASYYLRFPFAMAMPGKLHGIELSTIKFTDNTRGFGFKQHWQR
jgi:uncharacterized protein